MSPKPVFAALLLLHCAVTWSFAGEERDWGINPTRDIRQPPYTAPTPMLIPGAEVISTTELRSKLMVEPAPVLVDVASGDSHLTIQGARWIPGAGRGNHFFDELQAQLAGYLDQVSQGDKGRPLAFFCVNAQCWLSYNASLRAVALGYTHVYWYRGGLEAWKEAGLPMSKVSLAPESPGAASF